MNAIKEIAIGLAMGAFLGVGIFMSIPDAAAEDPILQSEFPCQEDEVLAYDPRFGTEHIGCIHIDELMSR